MCLDQIVAQKEENALAVDSHSQRLAPIPRCRGIKGISNLDMMPGCTFARVQRGTSNGAVGAGIKHLWHLVFDPRLVLRMSHASRINEESARLGILGEGGIECWILWIRARDCGRHVVDNNAQATPPKNRQAASRASQTDSTVCVNVGQTN
jgi:hypothetical protein